MPHVAHRNAAQHALRMEWLRRHDLRHFLGTHPGKKDRSIWDIFRGDYRGVAVDGEELFYEQTLGVYSWAYVRVRKFGNFQIEGQQPLHHRTSVHLPMQYWLPRLFPRLKIGRSFPLSMGNNDYFRSSASAYGGRHNKADAVNSGVDCDGSAFWAADSGNK